MVGGCVKRDEYLFDMIKICVFCGGMVLIFVDLSVCVLEMVYFFEYVWCVDVVDENSDGVF